MAYDFLLVGAGISSAAFVARALELDPKLKILVMDVRDHLGGNCYDYQSRGSLIHKYGPHIFHTKDQCVADFLGRYTSLREAQHRVQAEVVLDGQILTVPFPYGEATEKAIGRELSSGEVVDLFFRGYSTKMWGRAWEELPRSITSRVPKKSPHRNYFGQQFTAMPVDGWTSAISQMFEGAEVVLGVDPTEWVKQYDKARRTIYCGRIDLLTDRAGEHLILDSHRLRYRDMQVKLVTGRWEESTAVKNICHCGSRALRLTSYSSLTGGSSNVVSIEKSVVAGDDLAPAYPDLSFGDQKKAYEHALIVARSYYKNLIPHGRLGTFQYIDMDQAILRSAGLVNHLLSGRL